MGWICLGLIIYLHSGWPEAFAVPDKSADQICNLLIDEIFPRHGQVLELCRDNGTENINYKVKETLEGSFKYSSCSYYHPQSNAKVERFHRTLHDLLANKLDDGVTTWDLLLNQTLAAIRFNVSQ